MIEMAPCGAATVPIHATLKLGPEANLPVTFLSLSLWTFSYFDYYLVHANIACINARRLTSFILCCNYSHLILEYYPHLTRARRVPSGCRSLRREQPQEDLLNSNIGYEG